MSKTKEAIVVEIQAREATGKNVCRRLRRDGLVPASIYGMKLPAVSVAVSPGRIEELLHMETGRNTIFSLALAGADQSSQVMLRDLQRHPISEKLLHVDFVRVDPKKQITVAVPVRLIGIAEGVKNEGGILDFPHREVEVACLPAAIPDHLDVDISGLHVGQHVSVSDLQQAAGFEILDDPATTLASVTAPKAEVVAASEEDEEGEDDVKADAAETAKPAGEEK